MGLTGWEGLKVAGEAIKKIGVDGEAFEDANPGEKFVPGKTYIVEVVVETLKDLGVEIMD